MVQERDPEFLRRLEQAIFNLPQLQREIFLAHRVHDLSYDEIGLRTGLSVRQVEQHMARAICKIDRQMCGEGLSFPARLVHVLSSLSVRREPSDHTEKPVAPGRARIALERSLRRDPEK